MLNAEALPMFANTATSIHINVNELFFVTSLFLHFVRVDSNVFLLFHKQKLFQAENDNSSME